MKPAHFRHEDASHRQRGQVHQRYLREVSVGMRWLLLIAALVVGVFSLRYLLPNPPAVPQLESYLLDHTIFVLHVVSASIALILGPMQFYHLKKRAGKIHRVTGRTYVIAVCVAWLSSVPIALDAHTGRVAALAFLFLGTAWALTTAVGVFSIRKRLLSEHKEWMLRSFALTCAGITLRIYLGISAASHIPIAISYPFIAWLCWVPNLVVAEIIIRARREQNYSHATA